MYRLFKLRWSLPLLILSMVCTLPGVANLNHEYPSPTSDRKVPVDYTETEYWKRARVVVQFFEADKIRAENGIAISLAGADVSSLNSVLSKFNATLNTRFFRSYEELEVDRKFAEEFSGEEAPDLTRFAEIDVPRGVIPDELLYAIETLPLVDDAWHDPIPQLPDVTDIPPETPLYELNQGYTESAPYGIGAVAVRLAYPGAAGESVWFTDIEGGWNPDHEDLDISNDAIFGQIIHDEDEGWIHHGTAVVGEVVGEGNEYGITGIVPATSFVWMVSVGNMSAAAAVNLAASDLISNVGDVFLIELHAEGPEPPDGIECECNCGQFRYIAMEYWRDTFDAILTATLSGRVCVEAAGNGSMNLDWETYNGRFDREVRDSGAIVCGAVNPNNLVGECWTNNGSRVDLYGWGRNVATTGYGNMFDGGNDFNQLYTSSFSGTSSASPIVTGAVIALQGAVKAISDSTWTAWEIKEFLGEYGTPDEDPSRLLGHMPDLERALAELMPGPVVENVFASSDDFEGIQLSWENSDPPVEFFLVERMTDDYAIFEVLAETDELSFYDDTVHEGEATYRIRTVSEEFAPGVVVTGFRIPVQDPPIIASPLPDLEFLIGANEAYGFDLDTVFVEPDFEEMSFSAAGNSEMIFANIVRDQFLSVRMDVDTPLGEYELYVSAEDPWFATAIDTLLLHVVEAHDAPEDAESIPIEFGITAIHPNPFNSEALIHFSLPGSQRVRVLVYDLLGREVQTLANGNFAAGTHTVQLQSGFLSAGMYFVKLQGESHSVVQKVVVLE
ncbi:S8 family peptidase [bacterium]|nr:S8 family peptidase [bacterium]